MSKATLTTLTPVHVGSGQKLSANSEFIYFHKQNQLAIIDERKIISIIGEDNVDHWVSVIDKQGDLLDLVKTRFKGELQPEDIALRTLDYEGDKLKDALNEQIHTSLKGAYIPGSSIKGAIRTAVFAIKILNKKNAAKRALTGRKLTDMFLTKEIFGENSNDNLFRFIQLGDAHFTGIDTVALTGKILNLNYDKWRIKSGQEELVECIPQGVSTSLSFKIDRDLLKKNAHIPNTAVLATPGQLCKIVNTHTIKLLDDEIIFWEDEIDQCDTPDSIDVYIERLRDLKAQTESAKDNEMIFRMGFGSGWNFSTGAWAKDESLLNEDKYNKFKAKVRKPPRNNSYGDNVPFPKTRKLVSSDDGLLGFVKLTIN